MNVAEIISSRKFIYIVATVIVALHLNPYYVIPTGTRGVITQFGVIQRVVPEGVIVLPPWKRLTIFNMRAEAEYVEEAEANTSDAQPVRASLMVHYSLAPDRLTEVYTKFSPDGNLSSYVQTATQEVFEGVIAGYDASEIIGRRAQVSADISKALNSKLNLYGANLISIEMQGFSFSEFYKAAIKHKGHKPHVIIKPETETESLL